MKIRIGNDFVFNWAIERGGLPEDLLSVIEKHLHLSVFGKRVELVEGVDYDITGNVIRIEVTPAIANIIGTYKVEFHYILPDNGLIDEERKCAVDVDAFQIVAKTAQADDSTEFSMTSDMAIAFKGVKGDSAYKVWLDAGNIGTEEDYFAYLRQPAIDAGASISELEGEIQVSEGLRVQAESERVQAFAQMMGEADDKIEEMDTTLSTYDGRVTQVESDISQLAGEVNQKANKTTMFNMLTQLTGFDAEVLSLIQQLESPLSKEQLERLDLLVKEVKLGLNIATLSDAFDAFYVFAGETKESSLKNLAKIEHNCETVNEVEFTALEGLKVNGVDSYLRTNFNPSVHGVQYQVNNASLGIYTRSSILENSIDFGARNGLNVRESSIMISNASQRSAVLKINTSTSASSIASGMSKYDGMVTASLLSDSDFSFFKNNSLVRNENTSYAKILPIHEFYIGCMNNGGTPTLFASKQYSFAFIGRGLSEIENQHITQAFQRYMNSMEKGVVIQAKEPTLIITFDDGVAEMNTIVKDLFKSRNVRSTMYIVGNRIGTPGYLTIKDMQELHAEGFDLQCHTFTHPHSTLLTEEELLFEYEQNDNFFRNIGLPAPRHHAYPHGDDDARVNAITALKRLTGRDIGNSNAVISDYLFSTYSFPTAKALDRATDSSTYKETIDLIIGQKKCATFYAHGVYVNSKSESIYPDPTKISVLEEIIDYALSNGVKIKTISELYKGI